MRTMPCAACGKPVNLAEPHHALNASIEQEDRRGKRVTVIEAETVGVRHLTCGPFARQTSFATLSGRQT